jgi:hypothetical protein
MTLVVISAALLGLALGLRFNVFILVPTTLIGLVAIALGATQADIGFGAVAVAMILFALVLQVGYFGGISLRGALSAARATKSV